MDGGLTLRFLTVLAALLTWAGMAGAGWQALNSDDGAYFYGVADGGAVDLMCIGRSAQGLNPALVDAHETAPTADFTLRLEFTNQFLPITDTYERHDVVIWTDRGGVRLPRVVWDELYSVWSVSLSMTDPLILSLFDAGRLVLGAEAGPFFEVPVDGLAAALEAAMGHCVANYRRMGLTVPPELSRFQGAAAPGAQGGSMAGIAEQAIQRGCEGGARREDGYLLRGDLDGDAIEDVVLDWGAVACLNGYPRPFCGASQCSADVFLSQLYPQKGQPEGLLALGVSLVPLSNGQMGVLLAGNLSACRSVGMNACESIWYWNGVDIVKLLTRPVQ